ncbi:MAG: universal stress protein [Desulfomonilaceae bacterium]
MKVLVAVDKNPETFVGLRFACHLFQNCDAEIDALHVKPDLKDIAAESYAPFLTKNGLEDAIEADVQKVDEIFREECRPCVTAKIPVTLQITEGEPAEEILGVAQEDGHDVIVLGAHEQSYVRGLLLGAVHAKILHNARQPVLIVRQFREVKRVLAVYRGAGADDEALDFMARVLKDKQVETTILHVQETDKSESDEYARNCLQKGAQILRKYDYEPITKLIRGDFLEEILKDVAVHRYDLIVLGAYGRGKPKYLRMISDEALNLARLTHRPILVYRSTHSDK